MKNERRELLGKMTESLGSVPTVSITESLGSVPTVLKGRSSHRTAIVWRKEQEMWRKRKTNDGVCSVR
jgi:hypothetical protein